MTRLFESTAALWGGLVVTLVCCFTPVLVVLAGLVGLGAVVGFFDYALMVALGFFIVALAIVHGRRGNRRFSWGAGAAAWIGFAIFFGRIDPWFAGLLAAGGIVAALAGRGSSASP